MSSYLINCISCSQSYHMSTREPIYSPSLATRDCLSHVLSLVKSYHGTWDLRKAFYNTLFSTTKRYSSVSHHSNTGVGNYQTCQAGRIGWGSGDETRIKVGALLHFARKTILGDQASTVHFPLFRNSPSWREWWQLQLVSKEDCLWLVPPQASGTLKASRGALQVGAPRVWRGRSSAPLSRQLKWMSGKAELQNMIKDKVSAVYLLVHVTGTTSNTFSCWWARTRMRIGTEKDQ